MTPTAKPALGIGTVVEGTLDLDGALRAAKALATRASKYREQRAEGMPVPRYRAGGKESP